MQAQLRLSLVRTSVMPKGVEHHIWQGHNVTRWGVRTSVMPKGVEHMQSQNNEPNNPCENLCDAERR